MASGAGAAREEAARRQEDVALRVRARLTAERLRLWEPPYSAAPAKLQELAQKYSEELQQDYNSVLLALQELQLHAVGRAKANDEFNESGLATFRVRASVPNEKIKQFNVQRRLDVLGSELISEVAKEIPINDSRIKLIFNGKVINSKKTLEEQGLKNGVQLLALVMTESAEKLRQDEDMYMEMKATRDDAELLSEYVDDADETDSGYMKLEDQSGNVVRLPTRERRALMVGMALHEHGRTAVRNEDYRLALVLLLEADRHFSECNAAVLSSVDNWALLQLDVAWCYLCLESLAAASDAGQRLQRAEQALQQSYGPNMERLIALKGTAANERTLLMRLHLLQAIVAYHQNDRAKAKQLLDNAESELNDLRVDESGVSALVELGWSRGQARTGLRAAGGDLDGAHHYLTGVQEQREQARAEAKKERMQRLLGTCVNGEWVSQQFVDLLTGMGFQRRLAIAALKNSNNHVSDAVRIIQEQPELLSESMDASESFNSLDSLDESDSEEAREELVRQLEAMGYDAKMCKIVLKNTMNDIDAAIEILVQSGGALQAAIEGNVGNPSTSHTTANTSKTISDKERVEKRKRRKEREAAFNRLNTAISNTDDDYLDTSLQQEETFLAQYKSLLH